MKGRIVIETHQSDEEFGVAVTVDGLNVFEALGLLEIAKIQHLQSKSMPDGTIYPPADWIE